tara:strand:+ start:1069 stop:1374 length:306 start_codon:yes stop_codon:yes gene_type:complete
MITIIEAILKIDEKAQVSVVGEDIDTAVLTWSSSEISRADIKTKMAELQTAYDNNKYQRDRAEAYPSIQEQLDMQYWDNVNGTTNWKDAIAKVKSDIPKEA